MSGTLIVKQVKVVYIMIYLLSSESGEEHQPYLMLKSKLATQIKIHFMLIYKTKSFPGQQNSRECNIEYVWGMWIVLQQTAITLENILHWLIQQCHRPKHGVLLAA